MLSTYNEKTEPSDTTNLQSSIVNIQFRLVRVGYFLDLTYLFLLFQASFVLKRSISPVDKTAKS